MLLFSALASAEQPRPLPNTFIHDFAQVIAPDRKAGIEAKAQQLKESYKTEIAIVTVNSLEGEDSFDYSMPMVRSYGIGSKDDTVRGWLILVTIKDRLSHLKASGGRVDGRATSAAKFCHLLIAKR